LATAQQSILMLSLDQLRVRETALTLMRKASYIVFNDGEARELTGEANPDAALAACIAEGVGGGIIITSRAGAHARWPHRRLLAPALPVATVKQEIGAGDCLTGVFAAALCEGESVAQAMNLGQAAAAGHVAGLPPLAKAALAAWADKQAPVSPARRWHAAARLPRRPRFRAVKIDGKRGVRP
jgi:sugar/nucleoside kinase (ribokinase family)